MEDYKMDLEKVKILLEGAFKGNLEHLLDDINMLDINADVTVFVREGDVGIKIQHLEQVLYD